MLVDIVEIKLKAGNGGSGLASFKREKFLPFGGPDGGDGGKGGNIYIESDVDMNDLSVFKHKSFYKAENGGAGGKNKMHGLNGADLIIKVPAGTMAYVKKDGDLVQQADFRAKEHRILVARGGKGGKGNVHYATSTRKAPRIYQPGEEGEQCDIKLEMLLVTDICIVGGPNSGKSTLLSAISAARPQIADYQFTTQEPVLGAVDDGREKYVWAEIPAIVAGSVGIKGIGTRFMRHLSRAKVLVYLLSSDSHKIDQELNNLRKEVEKFDPLFAGKKYVVAVNKIDQGDDDSRLSEFIGDLTASGIKVFPISAKGKTGLQELVEGVHKLVAEAVSEQISEPEPEVVFRPRPVDR